MKRKWLTVGIILLFIGVAVAPSINYTTIKASDDNDTVEVTTQACGIQGYGNTTVKLTREQYQNLEQYLVGFRARLNQTTTREEAVPIFKDAVVELNKYGLLPKGMSVEKVQRLVTSDFQNDRVLKLTEKLYGSNKEMISNNSNSLCLIAGDTTVTTVVGLLPALILISGFIGIETLYFKNFPLIDEIMGWFSIFLFLCGLLSYFLPATIFSFITFGFYMGGAGGFTMEPAMGWVETFGLKLAKGWTGSFYGQFVLPFIWFPTGVIGFTGIKLVSLSHCFYLGSALAVNVGPGIP
jgi:hypothetical protein